MYRWWRAPVTKSMRSPCAMRGDPGSAGTLESGLQLSGFALSALGVRRRRRAASWICGVKNASPCTASDGCRK